jgi:hypothetical protein
MNKEVLISKSDEDLESERRRLAYELQHGDAAAEKALTLVEEQQRQRRLEKDRQALAAEEAVRIEQQEEDDRKRRELEAKERKLRGLAKRRMKIAASIDQAMTSLTTSLVDELETSAQMANLARELGRAGNLASKYPLVGSVQWRLNVLFPYDFARPHERYRRSFEEIQKEWLADLTERKET